VSFDKFDPIVDNVLVKLLVRSQEGIQKYGCTLADNKLSRLQWLTHAQEEALDLANYLEVLIQNETIASSDMQQPVQPQLPFDSLP